MAPENFIFLNLFCAVFSNCLSAIENPPPPDTQIIEETDSDNDGMPDSWEIQNNLNPNDPGDALSDNDQDGLSNLDEYKKPISDFNLEEVDGKYKVDTLKVDINNFNLNISEGTHTFFLSLIVYQLGLPLLFLYSGLDQ